MIENSLNINLGKISFSEEDIPQINVIGDIANSALDVVYSIINDIGIDQDDLIDLIRLEKLLEDIKTGKEKVSEYKFNGDDSSKISSYGTFLKIMIAFSEEKSKTLIQNTNVEIVELSDFISELKNNIDDTLQIERCFLEKMVNKDHINSIIRFLSKIVENVVSLDFKLM